MVEQWSPKPLMGVRFPPPLPFYLKLGLIQVSSPLGILFSYKNSVVTNRLVPERGYAFSLGKSTLPIPL